MTSSYMMNGNYYGPQYNQTYSPYQNQNNRGLPVIGLATGGALAGGAVGFFKNRFPVSKDGTVADSFAKAAFQKHVDKNLSSNGKEFFKQIDNIISKVDSIKTPEEFKKLLKDNKLVSESNINGLSLDTLLETVNSDNLKSKKDALKKSIEAINEYNIDNMKETIKACWDKEGKKFVKPSGIKDNLFDVIKNTKRNDQWKKAGKYAGISAAVAGGLAVLYNMFINKN